MKCPASVIISSMQLLTITQLSWQRFECSHSSAIAMQEAEALWWKAEKITIIGKEDGRVKLQWSKGSRNLKNPRPTWFGSVKESCNRGRVIFSYINSIGFLHLIELTAETHQLMSVPSSSSVTLFAFLENTTLLGNPIYSTLQDMGCMLAWSTHTLF